MLPLLLHTSVLLTGSPAHVECGIAFAIDDPCRIRDCLHMLARHVHVHALITPPGSIPRLSQPPLQKRSSMVTLAAHSSTYCSFPVCARFWLAHMLWKAHFGRTFFDLAACSGPAYHCLAAPHSAAQAGQLIFALLLHIARGPSGPAHHCLAAPHSPRPERASLSFARPEQASLSYALCA